MKYLAEDRRRKPDGEHLTEVVKVRFTEAELEELQASAHMLTGGRLAPYLHDLVMEAHAARVKRYGEFVASLATGKPVEGEGREAAIQMIRDYAKIGLMRSNLDDTNEA